MRLLCCRQTIVVRVLNQATQHRHIVHACLLAVSVWTVSHSSKAFKAPKVPGQGEKNPYWSESYPKK